MIILGINAFHADASAAILINGKLVAAIEEERFTRVKHWAGFPVQSIQFCLKQAGITLEQVDHICIGRDPKAKYKQKIKLLLKSPFHTVGYLIQRLSNFKSVQQLHELFQQVDPNADATRIKQKVLNIEHHRSHLASAFYPSPFQQAAVLSIDGAGDFTTTMLGVGRGNEITILKDLDFPHSIGIFYTAMTQWLGFPHYGDEYKVMGLAPYGQPDYVYQLRNIVKLIPNGLFELNMEYFRSPNKGYVSYSNDFQVEIPTLFSPKLEELFGNARKTNEPLTQFHKDMAASVQKFTEEIIFHILKHLHDITGLTKVCIAGGVAQNSVANGKITRYTPFKHVYIPSAGHDAGISMGAAYWALHMQAGQKRAEPVYSAQLGSRFTNQEIKAILEAEQIPFEELEDEQLFDQVVQCLEDGGVVGWFNGPAEFGPRALGGRSILADPRRADAKEILNLKIKRRESFRPFAPSILKEHVSDFFELSDPVPFMEKVYPIRADKRKLIPAVTHVDGTGRLQSVDKDLHTRYYQLIEKFYQRTGIPILLNTSFNENEPIVNTPQEALACFLRTQMDILVLENCIIKRTTS